MFNSNSIPPSASRPDDDDATSIQRSVDVRGPWQFDQAFVPSNLNGPPPNLERFQEFTSFRAREELMNARRSYERQVSDIIRDFELQNAELESERQRRLNQPNQSETVKGATQSVAPPSELQ